jgi:hypothetical protein
MEKAYHIEFIRFENDYLIMKADDILIKIKLEDISDKLVNATERERNDFKISPSGYGIHWRQLDEDLSVNGLIRTYQIKQGQIH